MTISIPILCRKYQHILILSTIGLLIIIITIFGIPTSKITTSISITKKTATGTPSRIEREFKLSIQTPSTSLYSTKEMIAHIEKELQLQIDKDNFNPPEALSQAYYITTSTNSSIFFDIYFDTKDDTLFNNKAL